MRLSPTPEKSNMAPTWSGLSWQTKRSHCMHSLLVGRGRGCQHVFFLKHNYTRSVIPQKSRAAFIACSKLPKIPPEPKNLGNYGKLKQIIQ